MMYDVCVYEYLFTVIARVVQRAIGTIINRMARGGWCIAMGTCTKECSKKTPDTARAK